MVAVVRVVLGVIFLISGIVKLASGTWPETARRFGTPRPLVPVLPPLEIVLGALLAAQLGGLWVPLITLGMLVAFTAAIVVHVARGDDVPCGCFGQASAKSVSAVDVARNVAFCALALVAVVGH